MSYLTQVTITNHNREEESQVIEAARANVVVTLEEVAFADARAEEARAQTTELEKKFEEFQKSMFAMWLSGQASPSTALSSVHLNTHHDYDDESDEQSVDLDEMNDE